MKTQMWNIIFSIKSIKIKQFTSSQLDKIINLIESKLTNFFKLQALGRLKLKPT